VQQVARQGNAVQLQHSSSLNSSIKTK